MMILFGRKKFWLLNSIGILSLIKLETLTALKWVMFTIIQNVGMVVLFSVILKITLYANDTKTSFDYYSSLELIMPGLVLFTSLMNCFSSNGAGILYRKLERSIEDFLIAPLSVFDFLIGKILFYVSYGIFISLITYLALLPFGIKPIPHSIFPLLLSLMLGTLFFTLLGILAGLIMKKWDHFSIIETTLFPIILFSGTIIPNSQFPSYISNFNSNNPLSNLFETFRSSWLGLDITTNLMQLTITIILSSLVLTSIIYKLMSLRKIM